MNQDLWPVWTYRIKMGLYFYLLVLWTGVEMFLAVRGIWLVTILRPGNWLQKVKFNKSGALAMTCALSRKNWVMLSPTDRSHILLFPSQTCWWLWPWGIACWKPEGFLEGEVIHHKKVDHESIYPIETKKHPWISNHMLHVNIYLHMGDLQAKCWQILHTWSIWD